MQVACSCLQPGYHHRHSVTTSHIVSHKHCHTVTQHIVTQHIVTQHIVTQHIATLSHNTLCHKHCHTVTQHIVTLSHNTLSHKYWHICHKYCHTSIVLYNHYYTVTQILSHCTVLHKHDHIDTRCHANIVTQICHLHLQECQCNPARALNLSHGSLH